VRQQVTKSSQRVHKGEECEHESQEFGQNSHVGLFCHLSSRRAAPNGLRVPAAKNQVQSELIRLSISFEYLSLYKSLISGTGAGAFLVIPPSGTDLYMIVAED
jgi:hypothetical protein